MLIFAADFIADNFHTLTGCTIRLLMLYTHGTKLKHDLILSYKAYSDIDG